MNQVVFSEMYRHKYEKYKLKYRTLIEELKRTEDVKYIGKDTEVLDIPLEKIKELYDTTNIIVDPDETTVLLIDSVTGLNDFTDRYGLIKDDIIHINWDKVAEDFLGFGFDKNKEVETKILNNENKDSHFFLTEYKGKLYKSWINDVYIYDTIIFI